MNIREISILACFAVITISSLSSATPPSGRWVHMPDSIKAINNVAELESFLTNDHPAYKKWGVERLGQIGRAKDIGWGKSVELKIYGVFWISIATNRLNRSA